MLENNLPEKRKYHRFNIPDAVVVTPENVCQLVNISCGGLLFKCFHAVELPLKWTLDIIVAGSNFHLKDLPVQLVWQKSDTPPGSQAIPSENVAVKFEGLAQDQASKLDSLISRI